MVKLNENYLNLKESYLFAEINHRVKDYAAAHPEQKIIRLGIGDVTLPLGKKVIEEMHKAVDEMACSETFKGYGPEQGYDFLRNAIVDYYARNQVSIDADEIFVSDGAKSDTGNITDGLHGGHNEHNQNRYNCSRIKYGLDRHDFRNGKPACLCHFVPVEHP